MTKRKRCLNLDICMSFDQQITQSVPAGWPQVEIVIEILLERWRVRGFHTILNTWWLVSLTALNIMITSQSHLHLGLLNHPRCDFSKKKKKKVRNTAWAACLCHCLSYFSSADISSIACVPWQGEENSGEIRYRLRPTAYTIVFSSGQNL